MKSIVVLFIALSCLFISACSIDNPPKTIKYVDLEKYMGVWYEIASLPAPFQKNCYCTKAEYHLLKDKITIINSCRKDSVTGDWDSAHASGSVYPNSGNAQLKIRFFWPFSADYYILYVSSDYQTAIVGTPNRKYLWILSRKPQLSSVRYQQLVVLAKQHGYVLTDLHKTTQCLPKEN